MVNLILGVQIYSAIAIFFWLFNMLWLSKNDLNLTLPRVWKYTWLAILWPYQFYLQFTNETI